MKISMRICDNLQTKFKKLKQTLKINENYETYQQYEKQFKNTEKVPKASVRIGFCKQSIQSLWN